MSSQEKRKIWTKNFILTMIITAVGGFLLSGLNNVVPLHIDSMGGKDPATFAGTLNTCFTICAVVARLGGGHLCDHWGRRKVMVLGTLISLLGAAAYCVVRSRILLMLFRGIQGLGYASMCISAQTAMLDGLPRDRLSEGIGYSALGQTIVGSVGPMIVLGVLGVDRFTLTYFVLSCVAAATIPLCLLCRDTNSTGSRPIEEPKKGSFQTEENRAKGIIWNVFEKTALPATIIQTFMTIGTAAISILLTLFAKYKGFENIALFFTIHSFAALFARLISGKFGDKYGLLPCFIFGVALMSGSFILLAETNSSMVYYVTGAIFGIGQGVVSPVMQKQAVINAPAGRLGVANGTFHLSADIGTGLAGIIWGYCFDRIGHEQTFFLIGIWMALVLIFGTIYLVHDKRKKMIHA